MEGVNPMNDYQPEILRLADKGYACSQIMILIGLAARGQENPALVRSMAGLIYGCGGGQVSCGALTGGCCLLALYAGKGSDQQEEADLLPLMLSELSLWFEREAGSECGGITCETITGEGGPASAHHRCLEIVGHTIFKILTSHGFIPSDVAGRDQLTWWPRMQKKERREKAMQF
jgi:hypothetical protein